MSEKLESETPVGQPRLVRDWSAHDYGTHWMINNSADETHVEAWGFTESQAHAIRDALIANDQGQLRREEKA